MRLDRASILVARPAKYDNLFLKIFEKLKKLCFQILVMFSSSKFDLIAILPNLRSSYDDPF